MADNRIAYGLAKKYGIDTTGMKPSEVWEALRDKGVPVSAQEMRDAVTNVNNHDHDKKESSAENTKAEIKLSKTTPKSFIENMIKAKSSISEERRWRVDIHNGEDYVKDKLFTTKGGSCVAIEPDGNIISVCKRKGDAARGTDLVRYAVENGGDRLDAFGEELYGFYTKNGFEPVSWTPFNEEYAPDGWKPEYGAEPVIFYKYTGKQTQLTYDEFLNKTKPYKDYDKAKIIRDMETRK